MSNPRAVAARAASLLLRYPDAEVLGALPTLRAALTEPGAATLGAPVRLLRRVVDHYTATDPERLESSYVDTFDFRRRCCLHLTYYTHGDTRARGQALAELAAVYRSAGLVVDGGELPDYLPALLDLAALAGEPGWGLLRRHRVSLDLLHAALTEDGSVWAQVSGAVRQLLPLSAPDELASAARVAAQVAAAGPPTELVGLAPYATGGVR